MADLAPTDANVISDAGVSGATSPTSGVCGPAALTPLTPVYIENGVCKKADATTAVKAKATAVTLNSANPGQPVALLSGGGLNPGCTVIVGVQYVVSPNSGKACPRTDLGNGHYVRYLFFCDADNHVIMNIGAEQSLVALTTTTTTTTTTTP